MEITFKFRKKGVWSQNYDACIGCNSTYSKHFAKGMCHACYSRAYRQAIKIKKELNKIECKRMIDEN